VSREDVLKLQSWDAYKAEHEKHVPRATCQICERQIGHKAGKIAHHGYTRPWHGSGVQTASCYGARELCFEMSREVLGTYIASLVGQLEAAKVRQIEVERPEFSEKLSRFNRNTGKLLEFNRGEKNWEILRGELLANLAQTIKHLPDEITRQQGRFDGWQKIL
jgi:hypothetical protein